LKSRWTIPAAWATARPRPAVDQLHRDHVAAVDRARVEDRDHVGVLDPGQRAGLAHQPRPRDVVAGECGAQHLERDRAIEIDVARFPDHAHPTRAEHAHQPVLAELHAWCEPGRRGPWRGARGGVLTEGRGLRIAVGSAWQHELDIEPCIELAAPVPGHSPRR
jgi:hypothetical protein